LADYALPPQLKDATPALQAYVRSWEVLHPQQGWHRALEEVASRGVGEVAEEAALMLDGVPRAGELGRTEPAARLSATQWGPGEGEPGHAVLTLHGQEWRVLDYRENLGMTEELAELLGEPEARVEARQCLLRSTAASLLVQAAKPGVFPSLKRSPRLPRGSAGIWRHRPGRQTGP